MLKAIGSVVTIGLRAWIRLAIWPIISLFLRTGELARRMRSPERSRRGMIFELHYLASIGEHMATMSFGSTLFLNRDWSTNSTLNLLTLPSVIPEPSPHSL